MALYRAHSGAVSKELLLIIGGVLFVVAMVAVGWLTRPEHETATVSPVVAPAVKPGPAKAAPSKPALVRRPGKPAPAEAAGDEAYLELLETYREDVAALDENAAAYRKSQPVFAHYMETFRTQVLPLMLKGEQARQQLAKLQPEGAPAEEDEAWKTQHAPFVNAIVGPYLAGVGAEVYQLAASGKATVAPEDAENLGQWVAALQQAAGPEGDAWRGNPYESGTLEYTRFEAYLGESAGLLAAAMAHILLPLPPDIEALRAELESERQELVAAAPPDRAEGLPEEYVEPFTRDLAKAFGKFTDAQQFGNDVVGPATLEESPPTEEP